MSVLSTIEADASKVLHWIVGTEQKVQTVAPKVVAALGVLGGAVEAAIADVNAAATNPTSLVLNLGTDIADFKAVWPDVKVFLEAMGIKV